MNYRNGRNADRLDASGSSHWLSMLPILLFGAFVILIVHAASYTRDMEQFYWTNSGNDLTDFFSYDKMICILVLTAVAICFMAFRLLTGDFVIKKNPIYVPMGIYALMVIVSYLASDYKDFSLLGYNDRFEGTLVILAYLVMLFYIINTVNSEKNVKQVLACVGASMAILCLLGFTQAADHDFFRTTFGKKLITPTSWWDNLDSLNFTFQNREIYQTVFNINYVSFYLALIIPIFALVMIYALNNIKKSKQTAVAAVLLVALVAGLVFNLGGSKSMGGVVGLAVAFIAALVLFNKRLIKWWKAVAVLLVIVVAMFAATSGYWYDEVAGKFFNKTEATEAVAEGADAAETTESAEGAVAGTSGDVEPGSVYTDIDYFETEDYTVKVSIKGNELDITTVIDQASMSFQTLDIKDGAGTTLDVFEIVGDGSSAYGFSDERFKDYVIFYLTQDEESNLYLVLRTGEQDWPFIVGDDGMYYRNGLGRYTSLEKISAFGFEDNLGFGSGRGYIWSRAFGMLKSDVIIGDGADTFCINFPHKDYAGKYNSPTFHGNIDIIVDKPHCMYLGMFQGTGGISMLCFIAMLVIYFVQSFKVLRKNKYEDFIDYAAAGLLLGVIGFAIAGLFNDSSVSVMPLFYTTLGMGLAVNCLVEDKRTS